MIDYGLFMMVYKPSKLIYSSVHIDRVYHFIRDHFSRIPLYTYISFNGPILKGRLIPPLTQSSISTPPWSNYSQRPNFTTVLKGANEGGGEGEERQKK